MNSGRAQLLATIVLAGVAQAGSGCSAVATASADRARARGRLRGRRQGHQRRQGYAELRPRLCGISDPGGRAGRRAVFVAQLVDEGLAEALGRWRRLSVDFPAARVPGLHVGRPARRPRQLELRDALPTRPSQVAISKTSSRGGWAPNIRTGSPACSSPPTMRKPGNRRRAHAMTNSTR